MIKVNNITKKYGTFESIKNVSFEIKDGETVGLLGQNGAGKSTIMNIITGCIQLTSGNIQIDGLDIEKDGKKVKKLIGYMPENAPLYNDMTVKEFLSFMAELKDIKKEKNKEQVNKIIKQVKLENVENIIIKNLSKGYKQRISLAGALVGNPKILILDEPTVGLDPKQIAQIRNLIKELGKDHTIILSSHILSDVSQLCDKVIIINDGKIVIKDEITNLEQKANKKSEIIIVAEGLEEKQDKVKKQIKEITEIKKIKNNPDGTSSYLIKVKDDKDIRKNLFKVLSKEKIVVYEIKKEEVTLEDAFMNIIDKNKGGKK